MKSNMYITTFQSLFLP